MKDGRPEEGESGVFRRRVFYIPGFDPFPARRYRELYRKEGAAQAALSGYRLSLRAGEAGGWHVLAEIDGRLAEAEIEVLGWSDIVQGSMSRGLLATYWQVLRLIWVYVGSGALFRLMRLRKGPVIAALYPIALLLGQLGLGLLAGWIVARIVPGIAGWLGGLAVLWGVLAFFRRIDRHVFAHYLLHDFAFVAKEGGAYPAELEARLAAFRKRIAGALAEDWDEVLVIGHSSGAYLAISVLADLLRGGTEGRLALLTLGQSVPMVSFLPRADRLRADLHFLAAQGMPWVDVTAPGDGCAFALCDPVAVTGVSPPGKRWPLVVSAAFTQTLRPETWAALRWRFFRLHFQYLCAFDNLPGKASDYDYFRITAGPETLGQRFAGRAASASRIEAPASRYTSMAR